MRSLPPFACADMSCCRLSAGLARDVAVPAVYPEELFFASVLRISSPGLTLWCVGGDTAPLLCARLAPQPRRDAASPPRRPPRTLAGRTTT